jgi:PelA/Pel-15E family pectate lyase
MPRVAALAFAATLLLLPSISQARAEPPVAWNSSVLAQAPTWYASAQAREAADRVIAHQSPQGGWPKNTPLSEPPPARPDARLANTIDNHATTLPMAFLARMIAATGEPSYRAAFDRGLAYLLEAQYPNGGWPQFYPLRGGYYDRITFNDDAMVQVLSLLQDVAAGAEPYAFTDARQRQAAADAVSRGVEVILRTQVMHEGVPTGWCAQHDEQTLSPAWGRRYEPPSLSGAETVGVARFLMGLDTPSPRIVAAVDGAVAWLGRVALQDVALERSTDAEGRPDERLVPKPGAAPLWARFYELETDRPIFVDRESVVHYDLSGVERERRVGYRYVGDWPRKLLEQDYPAWKARHGGAD